MVSRPNRFSQIIKPTRRDSLQPLHYFDVLDFKLKSMPSHGHFLSASKQHKSFVPHVLFIKFLLILR